MSEAFLESLLIVRILFPVDYNSGTFYVCRVILLLDVYFIEIIAMNSQIQNNLYET